MKGSPLFLGAGQGMKGSPLPLGEGQGVRACSLVGTIALFLRPCWRYNWPLRTQPCRASSARMSRRNRHGGPSSQARGRRSSNSGGDRCHWPPASRFVAASFGRRNCCMFLGSRASRRAGRVTVVIVVILNVVIAQQEREDLGVFRAGELGCLHSAGCPVASACRTDRWPWLRAGRRARPDCRRRPSFVRQGHTRFHGSSGDYS